MLFAIAFKETNITGTDTFFDLEEDNIFVSIRM